MDAARHPQGRRQRPPRSDLRLRPQGLGAQGGLHGHGEPNAKETQERRFAHTLAHALERGHGTKAFAKLVLVAPPKLLGDLRENLSRGLQSAVVSQVHKDYTHSGVEELMTLLRPELHP